MDRKGTREIPREPAATTGKAPARILVVDDQAANVQVLGAMLGQEGYEIVPASDGPTALKRLALRVPDLILLDVLMPGMDGVEVCRRIRQNLDWQDIPIIFLSAADDKGLIVRALEAGGVDYVTKPFNPAEMLSRVRTHLALKTARDRLKRLAEDKDELLGILAHDLRNSLCGIQISAEVLRERMLRMRDEKQAHLCDNICQSTAQLLSFVREFLANTAADHGLRLEPEDVDVGDALARVARDYEEAARRKNLTVHTAFPERPAIVSADRRALGQVLDNLLSNAVKFSPPGKQITASVRCAGKVVECQVQDQGPGLTPEDLRGMFRRYGRLSTQPTGGEPSTGLGLSIVKKLVQGMNGELNCDSAPGQGATFTFRLPRVARSS
jgi:two-component system sensor histidine kinase/response regulator